MTEQAHGTGIEWTHVPGSFGDMPIKIRLKSKKGSDEAEWPSHLRGLKRFPQIVRAA